MKKYIILFIAMCLSNITLKAQITISSPFDKAVYQRSSAGNATITIAGQFPNAPCSPNSYVRYRILNISLSNGATISTYVNYTIATTDTRGRFFFTVTPNTGWYQIEFQAYINNTFVTSNTTKFGVGDVFIIAGQSNAQGLSLNDRSLPQQTPTTVQGTDIIYEAVVSNNYNEYCLMGNGKMPRFPVFSTITSGTTSSLGNAIAPTGHSNWCYTRLGNLLAAQNIPVAFFNASAQGSSIRNWYNSLSTTSGNWCPNSLVGEPYTTLKKTLNYYGSIFGVRAILWHQGESDNKNITNLKQDPDVTQNEYTYDLIALINKSRTDFNSQLSWVVSKASWNEGLTDSRIIDAQTDVLTGLNPSFAGTPSRTNNSALSPLPILGVVTDTYNNSYRIDLTSPLDKVHFNNNTNTTGLDGLRTLGDQWKTKLPLSSGAPIISTPMQNLAVTKSGSTFTLAAPSSGYTGYFWVANNNRLDNANPIYNGQSSISISGGTNYRCYLRKANGNIEITSSGFTTSVCLANRESAIEEETDGVGLKTYPNPSADEFTIEFNVPFEADFAKVDLTTMTGDVVKVVAQGSFAKGHFTYPMVGKELPSGTYICRLLINDTTYSTKLIKLGQ